MSYEENFWKISLARIGLVGTSLEKKSSFWSTNEAFVKKRVNQSRAATMGGTKIVKNHTNDG